MRSKDKPERGEEGETEEGKGEKEAGSGARTEFLDILGKWGQATISLGSLSPQPLP